MYNRFACVWKRASAYAEKQGFPIVVSVCVAIITATAVWASPSQAVYVSPTPPVNQAISAAQLLQESLRSIATTNTPAPTVEPIKYQPPFDLLNVIQPFNDSKLVQSTTTCVWQTHSGVDLAAERGTPVHAIADGVVLEAGHDALRGAWLLIAHEEIDALYVGMIIIEDYIAGDKVDMGDTIGYVDHGLATETEVGAHLHLETSKDGIKMNPLSLFADY